MEVLNLSYALELVDGETELLKDLLQSFLDEKNLDEEKLDKLINENHEEEAAFYVHYIKGASRQIAAERLAEAGQNLEDVLRKKKNGNLDELKENFTDEYKRARSEIEIALSKM